MKDKSGRRDGIDEEDEWVFWVEFNAMQASKHIHTACENANFPLI